MEARAIVRHADSTERAAFPRARFMIRGEIKSGKCQRRQRATENDSTEGIHQCAPRN